MPPLQQTQPQNFGGDTPNATMFRHAVPTGRTIAGQQFRQSYQEKN